MQRYNKKTETANFSLRFFNSELNSATCRNYAAEGEIAKRLVRIAWEMLNDAPARDAVVGETIRLLFGHPTAFEYLPLQ